VLFRSVRDRVCTRAQQLPDRGPQVHRRAYSEAERISIASSAAAADSKAHDESCCGAIYEAKSGTNDGSDRQSDTLPASVSNARSDRQSESSSSASAYLSALAHADFAVDGVRSAVSSAFDSEQGELVKGVCFCGSREHRKLHR